jgi:hypothetical protein
MNVPKKHHYLPQFYLNRFKINPQQGKHPHIYRIEKSASPKATYTAIKDTGCKRDYHTLDFDKKDKDRQTAETVLSKIESNQAYLVNSICENKIISEDQKIPLAEFITTMRFRVPAFKRNIESSLEGVVKSTFKILMRQGKLPQPSKEIEGIIKEQGYDFLKVNIANWKILQHMFEMAFQSENSTLLNKMKFQLITAPKGHHFITGDSPVALYHPDYDSIKPYGVGPAFKEIELTFPISNELLIKLSWSGEEGVIKAKENEIQEYNRRTIIMADSEIYSSEQKPDLIKKIVLFHRIEAGYKLDNLWYGEGAAHICRFIPVTK